MCGIFLLLDNSEHVNVLKQQENVVVNSFNKGKHRGPEYSTLRNVMIKATMGFHRLAINGLDDISHQPILYKDIVLICNGEIYNFKELYKLMNVKPTTNSDCEVIIHLYLKYGIQQTLQMLDGVFSFCLIDYRIQDEYSKVFIARDPYGVRPLYMMKPTYHGLKTVESENSCNNSKFVFASELKMIYDIFKKNNEAYKKPAFIIKQFTPGTYSLLTMKHTVSPNWVLKKDNVRYNTLSFDSCFTNFYQPDKKFYIQKIREYMVNAVYKRCATTERPIACLLSGGLDSSLIAALVNRFCKSNNMKQLETYSIGMIGSEDLKYAKIVADYLGTKHTQIELTEKDFIDAIPHVIYDIESYDTTTVRASIGNWLIGKYISENSDAKVIFNGDGSDELLGGYLYIKKSPDPIEFDKECKRLIENIYLFDVLRSDKCISSHGLEPRTPFLDRKWVQFYFSIPLEYRFDFIEKKNVEKILIREAFSSESQKLEGLEPLLPDSVLWRRKEAFSDGVSKKSRSLNEIVGEFAKNFIEKNIISELDFASNQTEYFKLANLHSSMHQVKNHLVPSTAEQFYYRFLFEKYYTGVGHVLPYFWMPKFIQCEDPSARTLSVYQD